MATKIPVVSKRNSHSQHLVVEVLRPARRELTSQQSADLSGLGVEHFGQDFCIVAVPGQPRLQFINVLRQDVFSYLDRYWFLANFIALLERPQPGRFFDLFQVRGTKIELPASLLCSA
jgi:hypothetical protein